MTTKNRMTLAGTAAFLALTLFGFTPAIASEVTGTLSAGASAPADGSSASGTLSGGVNGGSSISGTVSGGGSGSGRSSGSGSGNNNNGQVLGASIAQADIPGLPNTGGGGEAAARGLIDLIINGVLVSATAGVALFDRKRSKSQ